MTSAPPHDLPAWAPLKAIDKPPYGSGRQRAGRWLVTLTALIVGWILFGSFAVAETSPLARDIQMLAAYGDRSTGSDGAHQAADYIQRTGV